MKHRIILKEVDCTFDKGPVVLLDTLRNRSNDEFPTLVIMRTTAIHLLSPVGLGSPCTDLQRDSRMPALPIASRPWWAGSWYAVLSRVICTVLSFFLLSLYFSDLHYSPQGDTGAATLLQKTIHPVARSVPDISLHSNIQLKWLKCLAKNIANLNQSVHIWRPFFFFFIVTRLHSTVHSKWPLSFYVHFLVM